MELGKKTSFIFGIVVVIVTLISCIEGLRVPKSHHTHEDILSESNLTEWHGLDYDFGGYNEDQDQDQKENVNSTGSHNNTNGHINNGHGHGHQLHHNKKKNETKPINPYHKFLIDWGTSVEEDYSWSDYTSDEYNYDEENYDDLMSSKKKTQEGTSTSKSSKISTTSTTTERVITLGVEPFDKQPSKKKSLSNKNNDEDDYDWKEGPGDSNDGLDNLPTDNDLDKDKYFDPEKYQDGFKLHSIEDLLTRQWTVRYPDTNLPCIMLRGDIKLIVPLNPTWYNKDFIEIDVPYDAEASGTCNSLRNDYQEIILTWNVTVLGQEDDNVEEHSYLNQIIFGFATNWTSEFSDLNIPEDKYALVAVTATYYKGEIGQGQFEMRKSKKNSKESKDVGIISYSANDLVEFMTPKGQSMSCYKEKQIILGSMQLTMGNLQVEAFRANEEKMIIGEFSTSVLCQVDELMRFDAVMTFVIWFWIGALLVVLAIFAVLLGLGYRRRQLGLGDGGNKGGFGYKILQA